MSVRLHINIDHVATVRNARGTTYPDPVLAARVCEEAGAHGITAHLREDRRHIRDQDIVLLRQAVRTCLNLEMAATDEMRAIAEQLRPNVITLVPERREERTTEGGLDVAGQAEAIDKVARMSKPLGIKLSLFIAPDVTAVEASAKLGAQQVEFHTGEYAHAAESPAVEQELDRIGRAASRAHALGLEVAAGHGLTQENLPRVIAISEVAEVNIGHAVIAGALFVGLPGAVRAYQAAIDHGVSLRGAP